MIKTLNKCIHIILDYPKIVLSFLFAVTIFFGSYISDIKMDFSIEQLFSQDDPVVERFLTLREEFDGVDNVIYLFYKSDNPFSYENLIKNRKMVDSFESINGVSLANFIAPGLIMMTILQNAFANSASSIGKAKFQGNIVDILMAPLSSFALTVGYVGGSIVRGLVCGLTTFISIFFFVSIEIYSYSALFFY